MSLDASSTKDLYTKNAHKFVHAQAQGEQSMTFIHKGAREVTGDTINRGEGRLARVGCHNADNVAKLRKFGPFISLVKVKGVG